MDVFVDVRLLDGEALGEAAADDGDYVMAAGMEVRPGPDRHHHPAAAHGGWTNPERRKGNVIAKSNFVGL